MMVAPYREEQQVEIARILNKFDRASIGVQLHIHHQTVTSIVMSSEFEDDNLVDQIIHITKKEPGYTILSDSPEFFVCTFANDVASIVVSILNLNKHITVNINL